MNRKKRFSGSASLAMAALVAAGMTAAPYALSAGVGLTANVAKAGDAAEYQPGGRAWSTDLYTPPLQTLGDVSTGKNAQTGPNINADRRGLSKYERAMVLGNLALATDELVAISREPITTKLVTALDTELGVQSHLTAEQVAQVAAAKQAKHQMTS